MSLTTEQQTRILQITQMMFGAAPGAEYLEQFESFVTSGHSAAGLAQVLSGTVAFFGTAYSASLTPSQFADTFVNDLVGDHASAENKAGASSYIVDRMAQGADQATIISEITQALSSVSPADTNWGAAATHYNTTVVTRIVDNLLGTSVSDTNKEAVTDHMLGLMAGGQSLGSVIEWAATALDGVDPADTTWGNAATLFDNRIEISRYYSVDKAGAATDVGTLKQVLSGVTIAEGSVASAKAMFDNPLNGTVQDGYISGATVFVDKNGDGILNPGETSVVTDAQGNFTLPAGAFGKIIVSGGTDIGTNLPFTGSFTAPAGSAVVNPLTTLVQAVEEKIGSFVGFEFIQNLVARSLGLPFGTSMTHIDPINYINSPESNGQALGTKMLASAVQLNNLLTMVGSALDGSSTMNYTQAFNTIINSLAEIVVDRAVVPGGITNGVAPLSLSDSAVISQVISNAAAISGISISTSLTNNIATLVSDNNQTISTVMNGSGTPTEKLTQIMQVGAVAQGEVSDAIRTTLASGSGDLTTVVTNYTGSAFDTLVNTAPIGDVLGNGTIATPIVITPTTPPPSDGGTPSPTFTVTETAGVVEFGGTATGNITIAWAGTVGDSVATFTRQSVTATTTPDFHGTATKITLASGQTLAATAANVTGVTIDGAGTVAVTALQSTLAADLSGIAATTTTVTGSFAQENTVEQFTGKLGNAKLIVTSAVGGGIDLTSADEIDSEATYQVGASAFILANIADLSGKQVTGAGGVGLRIYSTDDASAVDTSQMSLSDIQLLVLDSVNISDNSSLGNVSTFVIVEDETFTLTAAQASGKTILGEGGVTITGFAADTDLSGITVEGTVTGTVTASVDLSAVDLTKLTALTVGADNGDIITATVSPQQYAAWKDTVTVGNNDFFQSSDETAPETTIASAAYEEETNTLTITGTKFDELLETGETASTDIKGRLDWSKLVWDINGDDDATANVTFELSDIGSAKVANATTLSIKLTDVKGAVLEGTADYAVTNGADTLDIAAGFARDLSDNAATTDALSDGVITIQADETAPTIISVAAPTNATYKATQHLDFTVTFSEAVTVTGTPQLALTIGGETKYATYQSGSTTDALLFRYTVEGSLNDSDGIAVASPLDLNSGAIKDAAENAIANLTFTPPTTTGVLVDSTVPTISSISIPNEAMKIGDVVTATITVADATGETLTLKNGSTINGFALGSLAKTNDTTYTATFTVAAAGTDRAAGADIPVSVTLVDPVGNESTAFETAISQGGDAIDANAPNAPGGVALLSSDDTGVSDTDLLTNKTGNVTLSGTAEVGAAIWVNDVNSGQVADGSGNFNVTADLGEGNGTRNFALKAVDAVGNESEATGISIFQDTTSPVVTAASAAYAEVSNTITITGTGFATLLEGGEDANTDIKARLDWTKVTWDIDSDDTDSVTFVVDDITSAKVTNTTTLTIVLVNDKAVALEGSSSYGGANDSLDVASGFFVDKAGNISTLSGSLVVAVPPATLTINNSSGVLTLGGTANGNVTIDLNAQTISEGSMPGGGPFSEVNASTLSGGGIIVTGRDGVMNTIYGTLQADTIIGGDNNDNIHWIGGADTLSGGTAGPGSSVLYFSPLTTPENAAGLVINASETEKILGTGQVAGGTTTTIAAGKAAWYGTTGTAITVTDQVTFSFFDSYSFDNHPTQFFGSDSAWDVIYVNSKISASVIDGGTIGGTLALTGQIANFTNAGGFVVNLSDSEQTLLDSMQIAGGASTTIAVGKVGLIGTAGASITNTDQMTVSNLSGVWFSGGDNQIWGDDDSNLFQIISQMGNNYINGGDGEDSVYLNTTQLPTNATGFAVNFGSSEVTLLDDAKVAAGSTTTTLAAGKLAFIGAVGTDITSTKQSTLVSIEKVYGGSGNDQFFGSDNADTFEGGSGSDLFVGGAGDDSLTGGDGVDVFVFETSAVDNGEDTITGFTAGSDGDVLDFKAFLGGSAPTTLVDVVADDATGDQAVANGNILRVTDNDSDLDAGGIADLFGGSSKPFGEITASDKYVLITDAGKIWFINTALDSTASDLTADDIKLVGTLDGGVTLASLVDANFGIA